MHTSEIKLLGQNIFIRQWQASPQNKTNEAVILLHGIESHSEWFNDIAAILAQSGYSVLAYDRDGWGMSHNRHSHISSYSKILKELTCLAASLRSKHSRLHLVGLSWGGMFALYAALRRKIFFDTLSMIAPGIYPNSKFSLKEKMQIAGSILTGNSKTKYPLPININDFTSDSEKIDYIARDSLRSREISASTAFETLKMQSFCIQHTSERQLPPTTLLLAENDKIIDNSKTKKLFHDQGISIEEFPHKLHSLIFEDRTRVAEILLHNFRKTLIADNPANILIMGAGAVGSMVGALLATGGNNVTLVGRKQHVAEINSKGLSITLGGIERAGIKERLSAVENIADLPDCTYSLIIITVKSFDTAEALSELQSVISADTVLLSLQNGISNENVIKTAYPDNTIIAGAICAYLNFIEAGKISWSDDKGGIAAGLFNGKKELAATAVDILRTTGLEIIYHEDKAVNIKWSKMLLNIAFNALNAVTGLATSEILADRIYGNLAVNALKEGFTVMKKEGIRPVDLPGYSVNALNRLCQAPNFIVRKALARITDRETDTVSSMQQDITRGKNRGTEIAELNGKIVETGKKHNIPTPANRKLCELLREKTKE